VRHTNRETVAFARHSIVSECRPGDREFGRPPYHRVRPSGIRFPARHRKFNRGEATSPVYPAGEANRRRAKDGRRFFASARPAPQEPVLITHVPRSSCALPNALRLEEISCLGWGHFRFASLWGESPVLLPNTSFTAFPRASFQPQLSFEKAMSPSFSQWRGRCPNLDSASRAPKVRCTFDEGRRLPPARPGSTPWRFGVFPRSAQKHPIIPTEFVASLKGCLAR